MLTRPTETKPNMPKDSTNAILEQVAKLLGNCKTTPHQVQEVQATAPTAGNLWDINSTVDLPSNQADAHRSD